MSILTDSTPRGGSDVSPIFHPERRDPVPRPRRLIATWVPDPRHEQPLICVWVLAESPDP